MTTRQSFSNQSVNQYGQILLGFQAQHGFLANCAPVQLRKLAVQTAKSQMHLRFSQPTFQSVVPKDNPYHQ